MTEASNGALRRHPPSAKMIAKTSILVVSVLLVSNLMVAEGISYSNTAGLVPAFAPTSFAPSASPTHNRSSKHGKKHRKSKSSSETPPAFIESKDRRRKAHKSRVLDETTKSQTAFVRDAPVRSKGHKGHKGRKQHSKIDNKHNDSVESKQRKHHKSPKHKTSKSRVLNATPATETRIPSDAKQEKSHKKTKHRTKKHSTKEAAVPIKVEEPTVPKEKGTKRKRRKTKSTVEEVVTSTEDNMETSVPKDEIVPSITEADAKPRKKKKRRKKHSSKPAEAISDVADAKVDEAEPAEDVVDDSAETVIEAGQPDEEAKPEPTSPLDDVEEVVVEEEVEEAIEAEDDLVETPPREEEVGDAKDDDAIPEVDVEETAPVAEKEEIVEEEAEIAPEESLPVDEEGVADEEEEAEIVPEESPQVDKQEAVEEQGEAEIVEEELAHVDEEEVVEETIEEEVDEDEETNEIVEQAEEITETVEEEATKADAVDVAVDEESVVEEEDADEGNVAIEEPVSEEVLKEEENAEEEEPIAEEENDNQNSEAVETKEAEAHRGVSEKNDLDVSSSDEDSDNDIDPDQDVVSFIEEVLHEDVRSWIEESDSHAKSVVDKTRGGHIDTISPESEVEDKTETTTEVSETPEIVEEDVEVTNVEESTEEPASKPKILDRESLERVGDKDTDAVVSVVTWNLAEDSPEEEDASFIRNFRKNGVLPDEGSDLVLISGQECENIKPRRSEGRRSREYRRLMIKMLGRGYVPLALHLLGGIQFGLFCKRSFLKEIEECSVADVTCGIGNVLHNKGAIAAFLKIKARNQDDQKRSKTLRMVFVAAHLAAHVKKYENRDADFWRISSELEAQAPEGFLPRKPDQLPSGSSFLFDNCDRVFFCGDLNYRLDLPRELTEHAILHEDSESVENLLQHDQLIHSMAEGRAFPKFGEGKITFMPTFKYDKESSQFDTSHKQRIPAWTDRILFQPSQGIRVLDYQSIPDAQSSDHRPVWGSYRIGMEGRVIPPAPKKKRRRKPVRYEEDFNY